MKTQIEVTNTKVKNDATYATLTVNGEIFNIYTMWFGGIKGVWNQKGGLYNPNLGFFAHTNGDRPLTENEKLMAEYAIENI